jgi:tetratricopeptide (TPR) repeat protein
MNRSRTVLTARILAALWITAGAALAQTESVLGQDNAAFARALLAEGYPDLAGGVCKVIEKLDSQGKAQFLEVLEVKALGLDLRLEATRRESDLAKRKQSLRSIIDDANAFIQENARSKVAEFVRSNILSTYLELATTLTAMLGREQDPAAGATLREEGQTLFEQAKVSLRERIDQFGRVLDEGSGDLSYAERQQMQASFNLARMTYLQSRLYAAGSPEQSKLLKEALEAFQDFGFDYSETLQNFQGIIYQGLCREALGQNEDALVDYDDTITQMCGLYAPNAAGKFEMLPEEADVVSGAALRKATLLLKLGRNEEARDVAKAFFATIADSMLTTSGLELLALQAESELAAGDIAGASATAQSLVDYDPTGWSGTKGREILGRLPVLGLAPDKMLRIADTAAGRGDFARALDLSRRAREAAAGTPKEQDIGAESFLLVGTVYRWQQKLHEASIAFDCAAELYPRGARAPEALHGAVSAYRDLAKSEKSRYFSKRADERMNALATKYPTHPLAANAGIWQGLRREDEGDFAGAVEFYKKIQASSPSFHEASFRLANATYLNARSLVQQQKRSEADAAYTEAEQLYRKAIETLEKAAQEALDRNAQQRLSGFAYGARTGLATLLIDVQRAAEVQSLLEGLDERAGGDPEMLAGLWSLRIRALQAEGKADEAVALFESLLQKTPDAPGISSAAGVLARALDQSAVAVLEKDPKSKQAEEQWRKSAHYYSLSVKSALDGTAPLRSNVVFEVAQRLYVIGLHFNGVPEGQETFVDWEGTVTEPSLWIEAARVYDRLDEQAPSYRVAIERGRIHAILGRFEEAEQIYARLFDQVSMFAPGDAAQKRFDRTVIDARPELVPAYLEWAVTSHRVGLAKKDDGRLDRSNEIYERILNNSTDATRLWWQAKFSQIRLLADRGSYDLADTGLRSVKRTTSPDFDKGEFGFKPKFQALEAELAKKVFRGK